MKTAIRSVVSFAALALAAKAAPFLAMGDSAELFLTGTLGVRADDNVLLANDKKSDVIFETSPGLDFVFGNNSATKGRLFYKENINSYIDHDELNTCLSSLGFTSAYDDSKTKMNLDASWEQIAQNTVDVRAGFLVRRDVFKVGGGSEISLTDKSSVSAKVNYEDTNYKRTGFDDSKITTLPVNVYFKITPKLDVSGGVQFRDTRLNAGIDSKDYFYNVGLRGEFTPKLTGNVAVGYTTRDLDKGNDANTFGVDSSLTFAVSEKTFLRAGITNDFGVSGQGASQRNTTYNFGVQNKISDDWAVGATATYRSIAYLGSRTDKYMEGSLSATYILSTQISIVGSYTYRNNNSALAGGDFNNNVFSIAANVRY